MLIHQEATNLLNRLLLLFVLSAHLLETARALSDKRLCADEHCKAIISMGKGVINYRAGAEGMISFQINSVIRIKSKGAGSDPSIWGIEVNGREGYAPKKYIQESKIFHPEKELRFVVDVEQTNKNPLLSTSEKSVVQENTSEAATTIPLNLTATSSSEHLLNKVSNEKISTENLPAATPVLTGIVDGTNIPILDNKLQSTNAEADENEKQNILEVEIETEITSEPIVENKEEKTVTSQISEQQIKREEPIESGDRKQEENAIPIQKEHVVLQETYSETAFENEETLFKSTEELSKELTVEAEHDRKDNISTEEPNIVSESIVEEHTPVYSSNSAGKRQSSNVLDDVTSDEIEIKVGTKKPMETEVASEIPIGEYATTNSIGVVDLAAANQTGHMLAIVQQKSENDGGPINKDKEHEEETLNLNSINETTNSNKDSFVNIPDQELLNNHITNLDNDFKNTQTKEKTSEITENENEEKVYLTFNENVTYRYKNSDETNVNSMNVDDVSVEKADTSSEREIPSTLSVSTDSNEYKIDMSSGETKKIGENTATAEILNDYHLSETDLYAKHNKRNTREIDSQKHSITLENSKTVDSVNNQQHITYMSEPSIVESTNSITFNNQQGVSNEISQKVPIEQPEKYIVQKNDNINSFSTESIPHYEETTINFNNQQDTSNEVSQQVPIEQSENLLLQKNDHINSFSTESALPYYVETTTTAPVKTDFATDPTTINRAEETPINSLLNTEQTLVNTIYQASQEVRSQAEVVENINPTTFKPAADISLNTPLPTYHDDINTNVPPNDNHAQHFDHSEDNMGPIRSKDFTPTTTVNMAAQSDEKTDDSIKVAPYLEVLESKENKGLFATIMGTVNNMLTNNKKKQNELEDDNELNKILMSEANVDTNNAKLNEEVSFPYCKNIGPNGDCPESDDSHEYSSSYFQHTGSKPLLGSDLTVDAFLTAMASKILEMSELIVFLAVAAAASLFFVFGYYCFCNSSREGALLLKLNQLESSLLATHKENAILKHNLMSTRQKLASIEDNSFGSNDMVASLKKELEEELVEKARMQEQINVLQKELENAADAGIELNKIVSELLSNQTGDESIISSVEELQKQLNEQQNTIYEINASLAEKSRENSELQLMIAEQNARYEAELANVQRDNDELEHEKGNLLTRLDEMKTDFDKDITVALEGKNMEIKRLQNDILDLTSRLENEHTKWQTSVAKIEALEECLKHVRKDPKVNISEVIDVANVKAEYIEVQNTYKSLKERFEIELDSRKLAENQLEVVSAEVEKLKQEFNQSEKDKLEAQTRLEVLANYFKDKENQLQKELSLKEAMWLKQQGETTTTVDRVTAMQEEIQSLKSQNDSLRAEIEAQLAAHKAQIGTLENRAHETWLAARQSDRRYEEARAEATALRRKLTALAGGNVNDSNKPLAGLAPLGDELTQAPSPIHMESPGSPLLGRMPPPPPFLPPPFMGPPPPFMGMPPPPPFVPPGEMRPAPLGRIMSPPPQRSGRFSPQHLEYEDYLDYEGNNSWHRYSCSPPPRTYRSLSPTDSRYNYGTERDLMSTYDTETDFSPPPSPRESRRRIDNSSERIDGNSTKMSYGNTKKFNSSSKGPLSSGSEKSFNTHSHKNTKTKKGNATVGGGRTLV